MKRRTKILLIVLGVVVVAGLVVANLSFDRTKRTAVEIEAIEARDLEAIVSASGQIEAKRRVNVSSNTMGKITRLAVEEGDRVEKGDFLLEIDPTPFRASVSSLEAALAGAEARFERETANRIQAEIDLNRLQQLRRQNLVPEEDIDAARTNFSVSAAGETAARHEVLRQQADLTNARHNLNQVTIHAELAGVVTRLNIEEGENVVTGTMNNPGTVLLTIADLSEIEAEIEVDETDVVDVQLDQQAEITIDAYPDRTFAGRVTRIGNSAVSQSTGGGQQAVNFLVQILLTDEVPNVRPGLSCTADITVARRKDAVAVPIQAVTVRKPPDRDQQESEETGSPGGVEAAAPDPETTSPPPEPEVDDDPEEIEEVEGVFVVRDGVARFVPVEIGISGDRHFEVLDGLAVDDQVVTGPYRALRELKDGDDVKAKKSDDDGDDGK